MRRKKVKGSYTIEAAIYIPIIIFILCQTLQIAIDFWQESRTREVSEVLQQLDIVKEFYNYQVIDEIGKEIIND